MDNAKTPLPGASIVVKGTKQGVSSDFDGNYEIQAKAGDVLEFSYVGFQPQTKKVMGGGKSLVINVLLREAAQELEDVVVVGYGTQKKANLTGTVNTCKSRVNTRQSYNFASYSTARNSTWGDHHLTPR